MFSVKWGKLYFNVVIEGEKAVKSYFSTSPSFAPSDCEYARQLARYFSGERVEVRIPFRLDTNTSSFTKRVLEEVCKISYGEVRSYSDIAKALNTSPRAVGQAVKRNPLPVIIPCHRVVGKKEVGGYTVGCSDIDGKA